MRRVDREPRDVYQRTLTQSDFARELKAVALSEALTGALLGTENHRPSANGLRFWLAQRSQISTPSAKEAGDSLAAPERFHDQVFEFGPVLSLWPDRLDLALCLS